MIAFRRPTLAALVLTVATAPLALAQEVTLALNVTPGTAFDFVESTAIDFALDMTMAGQSIALEQSIEGRVEGTDRIVEVGPDGVPSRAELTVTETSEIAATVTGQSAQTQPAPLAGSTVTLTRTDGGVTVDPDPGLDDASRAELIAYLDLNREMLPGRAVSVGDTWEGPLSLGDGGDSVGTFTLTAVREQEGRQVADVAIAFTLAGEMDGMGMQGGGEGAGVVDVATGLWLEQTMRFTADVSASQQEGGVEVSATGRMSGSASERLTLRADAGAGSAAADQGAGTATGGASAPASGGASAAPERFADDTVTFVLTDDAVEIGIGGATYPGRVTTRDGDRLDGTFTASGAEFPFEATRTPEGLSLSSGGSTYDLTREGDGGAGADNPLTAE